MFRRSSTKPIAVAAVITAQLLMLGSMLAAEPNRVAWSPTREDAVVIEGVPSNMLPADGAISKSLMSQRPSSLSRPVPGRTRTHFTHAPTSPEQLPTISGAPRSPVGLPVPQETYYDEGGQIFEGDMISGGMMPGDPCCAGCGGPGCNLCGRGCTWIPLCLAIPLPPIDGLEVYGGVQGFTGPANRGGSGSFGFHQGFNWGVPICGFLSGQWGATWTQNNFEGNYLTTDERNQVFATAGLFRRMDWGLQGGVVFDYLHDEWDYQADLGQLRAELSYLWCGCNEIGFWCAIGVNNSTDLEFRRPVTATNGNISFTTSNGTMEVNDLFAAFFRRQFVCGGQGRLFAGFTSNSQGLLGADATVPINPNWALRSSFTYATPGNDESDTDPKYTRESWNVGVSVVWTPCGRSKCGQDYCRPLFNVADNGTFLTRLLR